MEMNKVKEEGRKEVCGYQEKKIMVCCMFGGELTNFGADIEVRGLFVTKFYLICLQIADMF